MPQRHDLPRSLTGLARRNALTIRHETFRSDAGRLIMAIEPVLTAPGTTAAVTGPGVQPAGHALGEVVPPSRGCGSARQATPMGDFLQ